MGGFYVLPGERINAKQEFAMGLITSIIPTGGGALKTLSALKVQNPLLNIIYSPKVIKQMTQDIYHGFPKSVEGFGHYGTTKKIFGNDGIERTLIEIPGTYNGKEGIFEFIIENGSSLFDMGRRKKQMFFMFVQSFTNGQIMGFGC